jgi:hypothetical protein
MSQRSFQRITKMMTFSTSLLWMRWMRSILALFGWGPRAKTLLHRQTRWKWYTTQAQAGFGFKPTSVWTMAWTAAFSLTRSTMWWTRFIRSHSPRPPRGWVSNMESDTVKDSSSMTEYAWIQKAKHVTTSTQFSLSILLNSWAISKEAGSWVLRLLICGVINILFSSSKCTMRAQ